MQGRYRLDGAVCVDTTSISDIISVSGMISVSGLAARWPNICPGVPDA